MIVSSLKFWLRPFVHADRSGRGNGNGHVNNLVDTAADREYGQLTIELELTVRASRSNGIASFRTAEPDSILLVLTFQSFQLLVVRESVVGSELKSVNALNTGNVGLHFVRQSGGFQHFGSAAEIGELFNVNYLLPCGSVFLHEENFICANSHDSLPPVNDFIFRYDSSVPSHHAINGCVLLIGNGVEKRPCESKALHETVDEGNNLFALSFFAVMLIRVNIDLVKQLCMIFDTLGCSSVSINLIIDFND
nr:MAG TPA: hypothetical protein [Caudoviricetes sp.]